MTRRLKRIIFTGIFTLLSFPFWNWLTKLLVQAEDYVPVGEKGTEMVTSLGALFVLTIMMGINILILIIVSGKIFK